MQYLEVLIQILNAFKIIDYHFNFVVLKEIVILVLLHHIVDGVQKALNVFQYKLEQEKYFYFNILAFM